MPAIPITDKPNGPIPGENFTSDTKNYPWHRPPEITDIDSGIIAAMKQLTAREATYGLLNSLQLGVTVVQAATMFVISGIGSGKWAVDHAILLAGPVAKIMQIMADEAEIKYKMGLEDDPISTIAYYDDVKNVDQQSVKFAQEAGIDAVAKMQKTGGFAPRPPTDMGMM
jgi:hypothetical protein